MNDPQVARTGDEQAEPARADEDGAELVASGSAADVEVAGPSQTSASSSGCVAWTPASPGEDRPKGGLVSDKKRGGSISFSGARAAVRRPSGTYAPAGRATL